MIKRTFVAAVCLALAVPAMAANLTPTGGVSVNTGAGFKAVSGPTSVQPGDKVMVAGGSSATITFENGCSITLGEGVKTVPSAPACQTGGIDTTHLVVGLGVVGGGIAAGVLLSGKDKKSSP